MQHLLGRSRGCRGERHLGGEQRDGVGHRVEAGGAERLERRGVGAGPGEGQLPFEQRPGAGRADAEGGALLVTGGIGAGPGTGGGQ